MRRAHSIFFGALLAVWLVCLGLCLDDVLRGTPTSPLMLARDPGGGAHPAVTMVWRPMTVPEVRPGDRLLAVAGRAVTGPPWQWQAAFSELPAGATSARLRLERGGEPFEADAPLLSRSRYWPRLVASAAFVACAVVLFGARGAGSVRVLFAYTYVLTGLFLACVFAGGPRENAASLVVHAVSLAAIGPLSLLGFMRLDPAQVPGPDRHFAWLFALFAVFDLSRFSGLPLSPRAGSLGLALLVGPFFAISAFVLVRAYRNSDMTAQRRLKWVFLGAYLALVVAGIPEIFAALHPEAGPLLALSVSGIGLLPLCVLVGIVRHNFLDIDRVLSATAAMTLGVGALFVLTQFALPPLAAVLARDTGLHEASIRVAMIVLLIALLVPAASFLAREVARLFFASHLALEHSVSQLMQRLSRCTAPGELGESLVDGLAAMLRPESCVLYSRSDDVFSPAIASGAEPRPPSFSLESPLAAALREQPRPLARDGSLSSFQRAVLETLGAELVAPVRRAGLLAGFVCLGPKASGDPYTATERGYLALIVDKFGSELLRFDQEQTLAASRALQDRLRRYVPGTLAERLDRDVAVDLGEIEVSVLFVDIRGYSRLAETLRPDQIFGLVNRYTEVVSSAVRRHGGTVVEFNGDGMMAVFGAPEPIPSKERAAVAAGREIVAAVLELGGGLSAGVGIATGQAFVGNIQAVDRMIWTALGNTTNLASRLQQLTRDLPASIVLDRRTHELAGAEAETFLPYVGAPIRGRNEREDLFVLPLRSAA